MLQILFCHDEASADSTFVVALCTAMVGEMAAEWQDHHAQVHLIVLLTV